MDRKKDKTKVDRRIPFTIELAKEMLQSIEKGGSTDSYLSHYDCDDNYPGEKCGSTCGNMVDSTE